MDLCGAMSVGLEMLKNGQIVKGHGKEYEFYSGHYDCPVRGFIFLINFTNTQFTYNKMYTFYMSNSMSFTNYLTFINFCLPQISDYLLSSRSFTLPFRSFKLLNLGL